MSNTSNNSPKSIGLSTPAADALCTLKATLHTRAGEGRWRHGVSYSVLIELLCWHLRSVILEGKTEVSLDNFVPKTQGPGRPRLGEFERKAPSRAVPPSEIRKLAGVDPITQERKLW